MILRVAAEFNDNGFMLQSEQHPGSFGRGKTRYEALRHLELDVMRYCAWQGFALPEDEQLEITYSQLYETELQVEDAQSDILMGCDREPLTENEYELLKQLVLKSACDFMLFYSCVPDKDASNLAPRKTFYGDKPITAREMYEHVQNVNSLYFGSLGVQAENGENLYEARLQGFSALENKDNFLSGEIFTDEQSGERWTVRKLMRRFIWHDRIHAKAMYRLAEGMGWQLPDVYLFSF